MSRIGPCTVVCGPRPLTLESGIGQGRKDGEAQEIVDLLLWRNYRFFDIEGCRTGNGTTPPRCAPPTPTALTNTPKIPREYAPASAAPGL